MRSWFENMFKKLKTQRPTCKNSFVTTVIWAFFDILILCSDLVTILPAVIVYLVFFASAASFGAFVWAFVYSITKGAIYKGFLNVMHKWAFTAKIVDNYTIRTVFFVHISLLINVFFALFKGFIGFKSGSPWLITLSVYYLLLFIVRTMIVKEHGKINKIKDSLERRGREFATVRQCGVMFLILTPVLEGVVVLIMINGEHFSYDGTLIYGVALVDFCNLISAIVYLTKSRKQHSTYVTTVKFLKFECSLVSILSLQTAMLATFGDSSTATFQNAMNLATGSVLCVFTLASGITMVKLAGKNIEKINTESEKPFFRNIEIKENNL